MILVTSMTVDDLNKSRLALIAWRFRRLGLAPMVAVMYAVKNRVVEENWTPVLREVERAWPDDKEDTDSRDPLLTDLLESVDWVYVGGKVDRLTNGGTRWKETGVEPPANIAADLLGRERTGNVGSLELWK